MTIDIDEKSYDPNKNNINDVIKAINVLREAGWLESHDKEMMYDGERQTLEKIINNIFNYNKYSVVLNGDSEENK